MNKQYGDNQKNEIIEKYLSGVSVSDLSKQTGVARYTPLSVSQTQRKRTWRPTALHNPGVVA